MTTQEVVEARVADLNPIETKVVEFLDEQGQRQQQVIVTIMHKIGRYDHLFTFPVLGVSDQTKADAVYRAISETLEEFEAE